MKLDFNSQLRLLDGKEVKGDDGNLGKILATVISNMVKGNSVKLWDWALTVHSKKALEIDNTDVDVLYALIESSENFPVITKAQLLGVIDKAKKVK